MISDQIGDLRGGCSLVDCLSENVAVTTGFSVLLDTFGKCGVK